MSRSKLPKAVEQDVLTSSRRRCCICFGLNRDADLKKGQIAHLDQDKNNNALENLAFLCLEHHDEYDSRTSVSKGLAIHEVKHYRSELLTQLGDAVSVKVHFGRLSLPSNDPYSGTFIRVGSGQDSSEITITPLPDNIEGIPQFHVSGLSLANPWKPGGPSIGELSIIGTMSDLGIILCLGRITDKGSHTIRINMNGELVRIAEKNEFGVYGIGVTFSGEYMRVSNQKLQSLR